MRPTLLPRPTLYKGILMRSRLEADFARWLDSDDPLKILREASWTYEPQCFAGPSGQYLPDFGLTGPGGERFYVEVKPAEFHESGIDPLLKRMEIVWESEPDAYLGLVLWSFGARELETWWFNLNNGTGWYVAGAGGTAPWPGLKELMADFEAIVITAPIDRSSERASP